MCRHGNAHCRASQRNDVKRRQQRAIIVKLMAGREVIDGMVIGEMPPLTNGAEADGGTTGEDGMDRADPKPLVAIDQQVEIGTAQQAANLAGAHGPDDFLVACQP